MTDDLRPLAPIERGTTNLLAWPSAPSIDGLSARVGPYVPTYRGDDGLHWEWDSTFDVNQMTVVGNQIAIPIGPLAEVPPNAAFLVWGARSPVPTFDGPERCTVHVMNVFSTSI